MARFTDLLPVIILVIFLTVAAVIGYQVSCPCTRIASTSLITTNMAQMYNYTNTLAAHGKQSMEKRNITFGKEGGLRVGVKEMNAEEYSDKTQSWLVKAYNESAWPAYKSRLWNKGAVGQGTGVERSSAVRREAAKR